MSKEIKLTWANIEKDINTLAKSFVSGRPDAIVGIGRGGLIPAVLLSNKLSVKTVVNFSLQSYNEKKKTEKFVFGQVPDNEFLAKYKRKKIIVVDDLSDKGTTLLKVQEYFNDLMIKPAYITLYIKESTTFVPDLYARSYKDDEWLIFPWEKE